LARENGKKCNRQRRDVCDEVRGGKNQQDNCKQHNSDLKGDLCSLCRAKRKAQNGRIEREREMQVTAKKSRAMLLFERGRSGSHKFKTIFKGT
jgi:hypothetical protein